MSSASDSARATVDPTLAADMRAILGQRLAQRTAATRAVAKETAADTDLLTRVAEAPEIGGTLESVQADVARAGLLVRRAYACLLCEPEVVDQARALLRTAGAKEFAALLGGLKELLGEATAGLTGHEGQVAVTIVNHVPRPAAIVAKATRVAP